jgi:hypothetical protein
MVQSSGVGKTRAVLELMQHSQRVFVVYMNLRPADIPGDPCRTPVIADLIDRCVKSATDWQMLIVAVQMTLKGLVDAHLLPNETEARLAFYTQQQDATRQTFWSQVRHTFTVMRRVVGRGHASAAQEWDRRQCTIIGHTFRLANAEGQPMVLVLALDDCWHSLQTDGKLVALQGALDYTKRTLTDVVAILMDTDASVGQFAPLELPYSASSRVISGHLLNTPFFLFPIDLSSELGQRRGPDTWPPEAEYRATVTLTAGPTSSSSDSSSTSSSAVCAASPAAAEAGDIVVVVRYNPVEEVLCCRPLFATCFTNAIDTALGLRSDSDDDTWLDSVIEAAFAACMDTVARKLDAGPADAPPASAAEAERIRLFSYAAIRWRATTTSQELMEGLIRQQLGLLREVGPQSETLLCAYGLEPLLGRHVASKMTATVFENTLRTLHDLQGQGQLCGYQSRGDHAALVATVVLSRAHDTATARLVPSTPPSTIQNVGPVLLRDWLAQLLDDGASLWAELQAQVWSALDRAVVFFHSVYQVESDATPPITVEMARWYLQRGTVGADLFVPFAVPHGNDDSSWEIDLMDPDTYVLGVLPVQVTSVNADGVDDNAALLRGLLGSEVLRQFPPDAPRVGLVIHMKPGGDVGQGPCAASTTAWATDAKDAFVLAGAQTKKSTQPAGRAPETPTFAPCGFVKYFWNRIPCVVQQPGADDGDNGEAAWRLLWSMAQFDPFAHLTTSTLQQYSRTADGYARSEAQLQRTVRALGEEMFHIHRPYGDQDTTGAPTAKSAAVAADAGRRSETAEGAADDATVPMEAADGRTRSRKGGTAEPYRAVKRTRLEETQDAGNAEGHRPEP